MKRAMISQPMNGRTDREVASDRARASEVLGRLGYEVADTLYKDFGAGGRGDNVALLYLARSIGDMAGCDAVYFCRGWSGARGCCVEHSAAKLYGLDIIYEDEPEPARAFSVVDASTGVEADTDQISKYEDWAESLLRSGVEAFAVDQNGDLLLVDGYGSYAVAPRGRFEAVAR